jgi:hypothetical protein
VRQLRQESRPSPHATSNPSSVEHGGRYVCIELHRSRVLGNTEWMSGETDLSAMLESLTVTVRPDDYVVATLSPDADVPALGDGVAAVIDEAEGPTVIATITRAAYEGWAHNFVAAWLTLDVHSALEAVGLTAAFSRQLGRAGIPCNVIAGFHHDHILVPHDKSQAAVEVIQALARPPTH